MKNNLNRAFGFSDNDDGKQAVSKEKVNLFLFTDIHDIPEQWERERFGPLTATFTFINHSPMTQNNGQHFKVRYTKEQLETARLEIDELIDKLGTEVEELSTAKVDLVSQNIEDAREMIVNRNLQGVSELFKGVLDSMKIQNWTGYYEDKQKELEVAKNVIDTVLAIPEGNFVYENHQPSAVNF